MATVVYLPRYEEEREKLRDLKNVWIPPKPVLTFQVIPFCDLVVGSGGSMCRESALMGVPTINFHFWDVIPRYLHKKKFPIWFLADNDKVLSLAKKILKQPSKYRKDTSSMLKNLESPSRTTIRLIEKCLKRR
jgi:predicted glycosyltransferase